MGNGALLRCSGSWHGSPVRSHLVPLPCTSLVINMHELPGLSAFIPANSGKDVLAYSRF